MAFFKSVSPGSSEKKGIGFSASFIMVCIYIFLVIERPWESIRHFEGIPIERVFALCMIGVALLQGKFKFGYSPILKWVFAILWLHFILAPFAYQTSYAIDQAIEYAKMVILSLLMFSVAEDEATLKALIKVFVISMVIYSVHSLWEYSNGRYVWRMGIMRMVGVDKTFNDPNSFGASLVLSLPFVYALIRCEVGSKMRIIYFMYFVVAIICIILTGSRSAFLGLLLLVTLWILVQKRSVKWKSIICFSILIPISWYFMPEDKQERIRTLWDEKAGTVSAHQSAEGRMIGWKVSYKMFLRKPFTGVGAGGKNYIGYRMANSIDEIGQESATQSHVLYGQILAEQGIFGAGLFIGFVISILKLTFFVRRFASRHRSEYEFLFYLSGAIISSLVLLLVLGIGGHNFYRPLWLWLAAWAGASGLIVQVQNRNTKDGIFCGV